MPCHPQLRGDKGHPVYHASIVRFIFELWVFAQSFYEVPAAEQQLTRLAGNIRYDDNSITWLSALGAVLLTRISRTVRVPGCFLPMF
jgi:hypothetical protein